MSLLKRSIFALALAVLLASPLSGCGVLGNSGGSNLAGGGRAAGDAGCGSAQANISLTGNGNGGACLMPPCSLGSSSTSPNGAVVVVITGWACNPTAPGSQPSGQTLPTTPPSAGAAAAALVPKATS